MQLDQPPPRETRFGSPLGLSRVHWVRPEVVVEVTYLTRTEAGLLRAVSYQSNGSTRKGPVYQPEAEWLPQAGLVQWPA